MKYRKCHVDTYYDLNSRGKKKGAARPTATSSGGYADDAPF